MKKGTLSLEDFDMSEDRFYEFLDGIEVEVSKTDTEYQKLEEEKSRIISSSEAIDRIVNYDEAVELSEGETALLLKIWELSIKIDEIMMKYMYLAGQRDMINTLKSIGFNK
jgi:hypothetical protein